MAEVRILYACRAHDGAYYETHKRSLEQARVCAIARVSTSHELIEKMDGSHDLVIVFGNGLHFIDAIQAARRADVRTPVLYLYTVFVPEEVGVEPLSCIGPLEIDAAIKRLLGTAS